VEVWPKLLTSDIHVFDFLRYDGISLLTKYQPSPKIRPVLPFYLIKLTPTMFAARQASQSVFGAVQRRTFSATASNVSSPNPTKSSGNSH